MLKVGEIRRWLIEPDMNSLEVPQIRVGDKLIVRDIMLHFGTPLVLLLDSGGTVFNCPAPYLEEATEPVE